MYRSAEGFMGRVGGFTETLVYSISRPADTVQYSVGDIVSNNAVAANCDPFRWSNCNRVPTGTFTVVRLRMYKTSASLTNAAFRVHLFTAQATQNSADNVAISLTPSGASSLDQYLGAVDITMTQAWASTAYGFSDSLGIFVKLPPSQANVSTPAVGRTLFGYIEARAAYTPASGENFGMYLDVVQD
jgi:hypothetical protein